MASVNKVIVLGNLGQDPELRNMPNGSAVCNISVATTRKWKDGNGDKVEETEWHRIVFFNRLAEVAGEYLEKGQPVYVEGRLRTRKWQDKEGVDRYTTEIVAENLQLLGGRRDEGGGRERGGRNEEPRRGAAPARGNDRGSRGDSAPARRESGRAASKPAGGASGFDDMDDDIPF